MKACELNPDLARRINVEGVANLLSQTVPRGVRLVHLSIDLVFSGERDGGYVEDDPIDPATVYGKTMALGEQLILAADPTACILRISLPMGMSFNGHAGAIDWITSRMKKSRPATLYFDEVRTPTYTDCMNPLYEAMLSNRMCGVFHAGGPRRLSLYQIGQIINRVGGYDPRLLHGIPRRQAGPIPPRAGNVSMDSGKLLAALGYNPFAPWPLDDALTPTDPHWHAPRGGRSRLGGAALSASLHESRPAEWAAAGAPSLAAIRAGAEAGRSVSPGRRGAHPDLTANHKPRKLEIERSLQIRAALRSEASGPGLAPAHSTLGLGLVSKEPASTFLSLRERNAQEPSLRV